MDKTRRAEGREALERVLHQYGDVFGPSGEEEDSPMMLEGWVIVAQWACLDGSGGWTSGEHSGCNHPTRVGILKVGLDYELRGC